MSAGVFLSTLTLPPPTQALPSLTGDLCCPPLVGASADGVPAVSEAFE